MHKIRKRLLWIGVALAIVIAIPVVGWFSLTYQPSYYRDMVLLPREKREGKAKKFVAQSLQLRNDICNEPAWEAVFWTRRSMPGWPKISSLISPTSSRQKSTNREYSSSSIESHSPSS